MLNSTQDQVEVEVEVRVELGNISKDQSLYEQIQCRWNLDVILIQFRSSPIL